MAREWDYYILGCQKSSFSLLIIWEFSHYPIVGSKFWLYNTLHAVLILCSRSYISQWGPLSHSLSCLTAVWEYARIGYWLTGQGTIIRNLVVVFTSIVNCETSIIVSTVLRNVYNNLLLLHLYNKASKGVA